MRIHRFIATGLGTGYAPIAPGTVGSILGLVTIYLVNYSFNVFHVSPLSITVLNLFFTALVLFIGVWSIKKVHEIWTHDASEIVIDEVVGIWITMIAIPFTWPYYLIGLVLFRFFDIAKPLGIRKIDNMKGSWSVMLDDVLAGVYANASLQVIVYLNESYFNCF